MKKKIMRMTACCLMLALLASGCGASQEEDNSKYPKKKILLSTTVSEQSNATVVGKLFAERIATETDGNIQVVVYSSDQLSGGNMSKGV